MAGRLTTMACFLAVSVSLGGVVTATGEVSSMKPAPNAIPELHPMVPLQVSAEAVIQVPARLAAVKPEFRVSSDNRPVSAGKIPVGCDRLVSVLARSAASRQLGRCIT